MATAYFSPRTDSSPSTLHEASPAFSGEKSMLAASSPDLIITDLDLTSRRYLPYTYNVTDDKHRAAGAVERASDCKIDRTPFNADHQLRMVKTNALMYQQPPFDDGTRYIHDPPTQDVPPLTPPPHRSPLGQSLGGDPLPYVVNDSASPDGLQNEGRPKMQRLPSNPTSNQPRTLTNGSSAQSPAQTPPDPLPDPLDELSQTQGQRRPSLDQRPSTGQRVSSYDTSSPRHPVVSGASLNAVDRSGSRYPSMVPSSSPPIMSVSPNNRAIAQQPTYVNPARTPNPLNPIYSVAPPRVQEEVCVECAMRDEDMADVDVTSPGVWDRESDVHYLDLLQQEQEEALEMSDPDAKPKQTDPNRPRAYGGRLTEQNLKVLLTMTPRDSQARQRTIELYVKTQTSLLEAEAVARARAMKESRAIDNKMRDAYDQLRRSAYDLKGIQATEDGVRLKTPQSAPGVLGTFGSDARHSRHHSRDVTLLENGMLVEHVDVRKEEKEERERRRREERRERSRARKSSRGSAVDVTSMYSVHSPLPPQDGGLQTSRSAGDGSGQRPYSRYSQSSSRPMSVTTLPLTLQATRPTNARLPSQVSLLDTQSISSASMNRGSKFFAFRNWSTAWRSQESFAPSGMSGSMMDMHVALHNEKQMAAPQLVDMGSHMPPTRPGEQLPRQSISTERAATLEMPKKKKGLSQIWKIFTGGKTAHVSVERSPSTHAPVLDDDLPLAPPPPLSYLVNRTPSERAATIPRHISPPLPHSPSPNRSQGASPPTLSSSVPTPTSPYHPWQEPQIVGEGRKNPPNDYDATLVSSPEEDMQYAMQSKEWPRGLHPVTSEPDIRLRINESLSSPALMASPPSPAPRALGMVTPRPLSVMSLHKSLPPLPVDASPSLTPPDTRPQTVYGSSVHDLDVRNQGLAIPRPGFRGPDIRRQSFGGVTTKPAVPSVQTLPADAKQRSKPPPIDYHPAGLPYDEFGASRHSLGNLDDVYGSRESAAPAPAPSKRRSKFGFASLFGKGNTQHSRISVTEPSSYRSSQCDMLSEAMFAGQYGPGPRYPRISVASRKAIEELVDQDPDFVAYRYPSVDQSVDLLRSG